MTDLDGPGPGPDERVWFALFGGVRLVRDGAEVELTQPKQRAILALLLATPGEPVYMSEIIDALWPGEPAATVTNQIHRHVGSLRRALEPGLPRRQVGRYLLPAGTGYRLVVGPGDCDVSRFRSLVREADQRALSGNRSYAARTYLSAVAVASAPPGEDTLQSLPAFIGLEDERVGAIVAAAEHCETGGEFAMVLPLLRAAAGRHRFNEALHAQLIIALTRTGRGAEALEVYARIAGELRNELGSSPGAALQAAQTLALRGGDDRPSSRQSAGSGHGLVVPPAQLPSPPAAFAGRRNLVATLSDHSKSKAQVLIITGMAGVGKTTLALHFAGELARRYPDGQLYVNLRGFDATAPPADPPDALRDMLQALGVPLQAVPDSVDARSGLLRSLLSDRQVLLVLDNASDYQQVAPLLPGVGACRVIITSRNQMPALAVFKQARMIQLDPFDDDEAVEFLSQRLSPRQASNATAAMVRLGQACGGLPLALAIIAARASANPTFPLDLLVSEFTQERTPLASLHGGSAELDLGTVFSWSYRGLSDEAARTFAFLSAHPGPEISTPAAVSISGLGPQRARQVFTELCLANLLRESRPGRFVFHDLVRRYALTLLAGRSDEASGRLVSHYVRTTREAFLNFGRPVVASVDDAMPGIIPETFGSARDAMRWYNEEREVLHQVCRLAVKLGDHRSALMLMLDWRPMSQAVNARRDMLPFAELAIQATEHVDELDLRAECFRDVAVVLTRTGQPDRARSYFDLAAQAFEQAGNRLGQAQVYRSMALWLEVMSSEERIRLLGKAVAIARETGDQQILAVMLQGLAVGLKWGGRLEEALAVVDESAPLIAAVPGLAWLEPWVLSVRSMVLAGSGRLAESVDDGARALELYRHDGQLVNELNLMLSQGDGLTALGRFGEAAEVWRQFLARATSPELVRQGDPGTPYTDGAEIIAQVKAKLAALVDNGIQ